MAPLSGLVSIIQGESTPMGGEGHGGDKVEFLTGVYLFRSSKRARSFSSAGISLIESP